MLDTISSGFFRNARIDHIPLMIKGLPFTLVSGFVFSYARAELVAQQVIGHYYVGLDILGYIVFQSIVLAGLYAIKNRR
jgi:hypothetical protein